MSFQYMALYVGDYQRDTKHLSCCEHGIYLQLLMHCWSTKSPLPVEDRKLKSICNARSQEEVDALQQVLEEFFVQKEDGWHNPRLSKEIDKAEAISSSRSEAGKKGGQANAKQMLSKSQANVSTHPHPHPHIHTHNKKHIASSKINLLDADLGEGELVCEIPLTGKKVAKVYSSFCDSLREAYPAVDVPQTLREIKVWNEANPQKRKTGKGIASHIQKWCQKEQNSG